MRALRALTTSLSSERFDSIADAINGDSPPQFSLSIYPVVLIAQAGRRPYGLCAHTSVS